MMSLHLLACIPFLGDKHGRRDSWKLSSLFGEAALCHYEASLMGSIKTISSLERCIVLLLP